MYTWNFDDEGYWNYGEFETIEECLAEAREYRDQEYNPGEITHIYIGNPIPYTPKVDCEYLLDAIMDDAYETCGEVAEEWEPYDYKEIEENEELNKAITKVLLDWLEKHHRMPHFGTIVNVRKVEL